MAKPYKICVLAVPKGDQAGKNLDPTPLEDGSINGFPLPKCSNFYEMDRLIFVSKSKFNLALTGSPGTTGSQTATIKHVSAANTTTDYDHYTSVLLKESNVPVEYVITRGHATGHYVVKSVGPFCEGNSCGNDLAGRLGEIEARIIIDKPRPNLSIAVVIALAILLPLLTLIIQRLLPSGP